MNSNNFIGNVVADPQMKYVGDKAKCEFTIAVQRTKEKTDFFDIECWEKQAENVNNYVKKGSKVGITGAAHQNTWKNDETGKNNSRVVFSAFRVDFLDPKVAVDKAEQVGF